MQQNPKDQNQQNRSPQQEQGGRRTAISRVIRSSKAGRTAISRAGASASTASKATSRAGCNASSSKAG